MRSHLSLGSLVTSSALAANLYVSSYIGTITSLQLSQPGEGVYSLETVAVNNGSAPNPAWLTLDPVNEVLYCVDEGLSVPVGSLSSYSVSASGALTQKNRQSVIGGPVSSVVYNGGKGLALAHYTGSSVTTYDIKTSGDLQSLQNFTYTLSAPGPNAARQDAPHPHQVIIDPTDSFVLAPDLGADLVRIYSIDANSSALTESASLEVPPGSGPRHAAFLTTGNSTYLFVISELANTVTSYSVTYGAKALSFEEVFSNSTYGVTAPAGAAAAEILISPDEKFLLTSSRNDTLFEIDNFDTSNSTKLPSDTLQSWAIDAATGELSFVQIAPAGGRFPRHFSINKNGTLAAVGLQSDGRVVIVERNVENGTYGNIVASIDVPGEVNTVIWNE